MSTLVQRISAFTEAKYGVNILELDPPAGVRASSSRVVGVVADLPWGPVNELVDVGAMGELFDTFAPGHFTGLGDYAALRAFINKRFGALKVCRIAATDAAAATYTFDDSEAGDSVVATARYPGALGNQVRVAWSVNADEATARDATVTVGSTYSRTYPAVATKPASTLIITDPGDPFVSFEKASMATLVPAAVAATSLAAGSDGTAVAADYVGSDVADVGIRKFYGEAVDVGALFVAECPTSLANSVNTGLLAYAAATEKGLAVLSTPASQTKATAKTYTASYAKDRCMYAWPRVKTTDTFDPDLQPVEVDGNAFVASVLVQTDPWVSPGGPRRADLLRGIVALADETASKTDYEELKDAGVTGIFMVRGVGAVLRGAVTTSTVAGRELVYRRRMADYLTAALAERWARDVEEPLDLDLTAQALGPVTGAQIGDANAFLRGLWEQGRGIATVDGDPAFQIDPFSLNTQNDLNAGTWVTKVSVKLTGLQTELILAANIGESVQIGEI